MSQFKFHDDAIGHVLADRVLSVPVYQRSYSWDREQVEEFWTDLRDTFATAGQEYFLGNLVFAEEGAEDRELAIIDGQQRLATTLILLACLRDEHEERGESEAGREVHSTFVATYDPRAKEERPRLRLNSEDNPYFRGLVVDRVSAADSDPQRKSHELICEAYLALRARVRTMAEGAGDGWYDTLLLLREFLEKRLRVVVVDVPTEADAFLIFETLNDRGADLTIADLLKNYLFRRARSDLDTVRAAWMFALGALDISAENRVFTSFLRHFWSSKYGATRERDLFRSIKDRVSTRAHAVDVAEQLRTAAHHYSAILNSDHDFWRELGDSARANVESLDRLHLEQLRPLLLALMQHFSPAPLQEALRSLVSWGVRGLIVGGIGGGVAEKAYCDAAVGVRKGTIKGIDDLLTSLGSIVPTDEEFGAAFRIRRVTSARLARYYLHTLERVALRKAEPELIPNQDADQVNLEHILPRNPTPGEWPFTAEEHGIWVGRLGNMVLLAKGPNDRIGNKPWTVKKPVLSASDLQLTARAGGNRCWRQEEISEAQANMTILALKAWPRER